MHNSMPDINKFYIICHDNILKPHLLVHMCVIIFQIYNYMLKYYSIYNALYNGHIDAVVLCRISRDDSSSWYIIYTHINTFHLLTR